MIIIGIAGGTGSGKSSIAKKLQEFCNKYGYKTAIMTLDSYYAHTPEIGHEQNFEIPDAWDWEYLLNDLNQLKEGTTITEPHYDFATCERKAGTKKINPAEIDILIVDGMYAITGEIANSLDVKIFIDTPFDIAFDRRNERDITDRGLESIKYAIEKKESFLRPAYNDFIVQQQNNADIVIPNTERSDLSGYFLELMRKLNLPNKLVDASLQETNAAAYFQPAPDTPSSPREFAQQSFTAM